MRSASKLMLLAAAIVAVAATLAACGGGDEGGRTVSGSATATAGDATHPGGGSTERVDTPEDDDGTTIVVAEGKPVDGVAQLEYSAGDQVEFTVESDAAEEVHVHGYDVSAEVPAGGSVSLSFPAEIEGIFEIELEELGVQIAELRVNP